MALRWMSSGRPSESEQRRASSVVRGLVLVQPKEKVPTTVQRSALELVTATTPAMGQGQVLATETITVRPTVSVRSWLAARSMPASETKAPVRLVPILAMPVPVSRLRC